MEWIAQALGMVNTSISVPGWVVLASLVIGAVFVFLLFVRSEPNENPLTILVLIGILVGGLAVGTALVRQINTSSAINEAKALEARAASLDAAQAQSAALGCLSADPLLVNVCEPVLFERPDAVASARALVRARMALVEDAFEFVRRRDANYLTERIAAWRKPLELDPYGLVAAALVDYSGCTPAYCPQAAVVGDPARIMANMTEGRYAALLTKYTPIWERNARNRGSVTQAPAARGPFGFAIVQPQGDSAPERAADRPAVANLPVEAPSETSVAAPPAGPVPLPPSRPAPPPPRPAAASPAATATVPRAAAPRARPPASPAAPQEPQGEPDAADTQ